MTLFHKQDKIGICDWCHTPGIPLSEYEDMLLCVGCYPELSDRKVGNIERVEEGYHELLDFLDRTGG